ncbi:MAG: M28 family peptidase, partial [Candidatus Oleimicrobiaceae bacterium]
MHLPVGVGVAGALLVATGLWGQQTMAPTTGLTVITKERVRESVSYLASDLRRGRNTPSPELDSCANFLARKMGAIGLDTSLQRFNLLQAHLGEQNSLMVHKEGQRFVYRLHQDFVPVQLSGNGEVEAPVAFVGYGITAPEYGYDDYQGVEVAGKVVLLFTHAPQERDTTSLFAGERETPHSSLYQKAANARAHGAVGVLVVADPNNHTFVRPTSEWVSKGQTGSSPPVILEEREGQQLVVMRIGKRLAEELVAPSGRSLSSLQTDIDTSLAPQSFVLPGVTVSMRASLSHHRLRTQNVVGVLTGGDPVLKHQVVVVGAHYDHLGTRGDTLIFNGADDNASGTAGLLAIAAAFAASGTRPKR